MNNPKFTFIDLFAGIGGFHFALKELRGKCVFASEWDKNAQKTYEVNHNLKPLGDITKQEIKDQIPEKFDILCAGFPCQAFSIAGHQKGFSDSRGTLFFDIEQIVKKHRPKVVFLENVKNLVSHDKGNTFKVILDILENKLNYQVFFKVMNTAEYANIPQNRERIFIVAFNKDHNFDTSKFDFPKKIKLTKSIHDILDKEKQEDIYYYDKSKYISQLKEAIKSKDTIYQWRRVYVRENKNKLCPTLTANMGTGGHNVPLLLDDYGIRKLTPKECFAFQGYDMRSFIMPNIAKSKLYMQAGNSVTMPLVKRVAENFLRVLYE
ncbi:DNA (cytosine-5-)-methyltransferase [Neisseria subflava]|jgi:DNA (cytosine-5-)-methyltransferase|uniref:DNA (cytosine-5-)-methyltransferase n=2 Tax=Neisseria TaxID=482 RepID=UPI000D2FFF17|nr:DNA (cytosine-5-)-methyltransferase [Neisseria subflava]